MFFKYQLLVLTTFVLFAAAYGQYMISDLKEPVCTGLNEVYTKCRASCEMNCKDLAYLHRQTGCKPLTCSAACICKKGTARNTAGQCVPIESCDPGDGPDNEDESEVDDEPETARRMSPARDNERKIVYGASRSRIPERDEQPAVYEVRRRTPLRSVGSQFSNDVRRPHERGEQGEIIYEFASAETDLVDKPEIIYNTRRMAPARDEEKRNIAYRGRNRALETEEDSDEDYDSMEAPVKLRMTDKQGYAPLSLKFMNTNFKSILIPIR